MTFCSLEPPSGCVSPGQNSQGAPLQKSPEHGKGHRMGKEETGDPLDLRMNGTVAKTA